MGLINFDDEKIKEAWAKAHFEYDAKEGKYVWRSERAVANAAQKALLKYLISEDLICDNKENTDKLKKQLEESHD